MCGDLEKRLIHSTPGGGFLFDHENDIISQIFRKHN